MTQPLLIEIGVEELPAIPLLKIIKSIERSWENILKEHKLKSDFEFLYTPRRLVIRQNALPVKQEDVTIELFGPPVQAAFKDGKPTPAAIGFAKKCGVLLDELERFKKGDREVLYFKKEEQGKPTFELLPNMILEWIASMSFGKMMRWSDRKDEFIRPIRWLQIRMGESVVPAELFGIQSSNKTYLHRMVTFDPVDVPDADKFEEILAKGAVVLDPKARESMILGQFDELEKREDITIERDPLLLSEVVAITENPKALVGEFDESFLELPPEVIITSMKEHQRYFPVFKQEKISNRFVVVSNAYTDDYSKIIAGNEKVLKPRLADALFFYRNDLCRGLSTNGLEKVQFIDGLGSLADKISREKQISIRLLTIYLDKLERETGRSSAELKKLMDRAIKLAKADLMSEMVYEFTELQGLMGYYYAKVLGEDPLVYNAIKEQYMPVGENAELPSSIFSSILSMSIRLDTLFGLFSVGKIPTGSKDPFALRRAVNGIVRIITKYDLPFDIDDIITLLKSEYDQFDADLLKSFIIERINKSLDANPSVIASVLASSERDISKIVKKVAALNEIVNSDAFREQFSTFKRVANICRDSNIDTTSVEISLFKQDEEITLYNAYEKVINLSFENYKQQLEALFGLKRELDAYFDAVMVNVEDDKLKINRIAMINSIYQSFKEIADIKEITV